MKFERGWSCSYCSGRSVSITVSSAAACLMFDVTTCWMCLHVAYCMFRCRFMALRLNLAEWHSLLTLDSWLLTFDLNTNVWWQNCSNPGSVVLYQYTCTIFMDVAILTFVDRSRMTHSDLGPDIIIIQCTCTMFCNVCVCNNDIARRPTSNKHVARVCFHVSCSYYYFDNNAIHQTIWSCWGMG